MNGTNHTNDTNVTKTHKCLCVSCTLPIEDEEEQKWAEDPANHPGVLGPLHRKCYDKAYATINIAEIAKKQTDEEILKKRVKILVQQCFENPALTQEVIVKFLNRKIDWKTINQYILHGEPVKCKLCGETSVTGFWCQPCIHRDWCCYCCILLGFPFYR